MKDQILNLIETTNYTEAADLLITAIQKNGISDDYAILGATICNAIGDSKGETLYIYEGLKCNPNNYELLMLLGNHYLHENADLAYLCYENALFHAIRAEQSEDASIIQSYLDNCITNFQPSVRPVSIVILSYNTLDMTKACIESIRSTCSKDSYELVVVDNASTDGSLEWLSLQDDIVLIANKENAGFPGGCNIGIRASRPQNDIWLLNSDTIIPENALFTLRMGLYTSDRFGAAGSICNEGDNGQRIDQTFDSINEYLEYAATNINIPATNSIEYKAWIIGFSMLIKRTVLEEVGYLDEVFNPGNFEDDDICLRIDLTGFLNVICHNSFIFHYGHGSFNKDYDASRFTSLFNKNKAKFEKKWNGLNPEMFGYKMPGIESAVSHDRDASINILEIGCCSGNNLTRFKYLYPNAKVYGTEKNELLYKSASNMIECVNIDAETDTLPFDTNNFDYIFLNENFNKFSDVAALIEKCKPYMRKNGSIIRLYS